MATTRAGRNLWTAIAIAALGWGRSPAYAGEDFPRLANIYLQGAVRESEIPSLARWDVLVLDSSWTNDQLRRLRDHRPDIKLFFYVCAHCMTVNPVPRDTWRTQNFLYAATHDLWWRNTDGTVASDWPRTALLNVTEVAPAGRVTRWFPWFAPRVEALVRAHPQLDGVFLDNFWKNISWEQGSVIRVDSDCNPTHNPAGCDGAQDPPAVLDSLWNRALRGFARDTRRRFDVLQGQLGYGRPLAIAANGASDYFPWLNGTMYEHFPSRRTPADRNNPYRYNWNHEMHAVPGGYLVAPFSNQPYGVQIVNAAGDGTWEAPDRTPEFERHKRFTLCSALLGDGYYSLDASQGHGSLWWEPEYDGGGIGKGYLGQPRGPVRRIGATTGSELIVNGAFTVFGTPWKSQGTGCAGSYRLDGSVFHSAPTAARLDVGPVSPGGSFKLYQDVQVLGGSTYTLAFWARASSPREIAVHLYSNTCLAGRCLPDQRFLLGTEWRKCEVSFVATGTALAGLNLFVANPGSVWLDDVSLRAGDTSIYRRDFERGIVLLNYTAATQTVPLEKTWHRLHVAGSPVWDGAAVTSETLPPSDGRILLATLAPTDAGPEGEPGGFLLHNEPNPFQPFTDIRFALDREDHVRLTVYDAAGRVVRRLIDARLSAGVQHQVRWNGTDGGGRRVTAGVYFYRLETSTVVRTRKVTVAS
jgi:hypothetical protein